MDAVKVISIISSIIKTAVELTPTVIKTVEDAKPFAEAIYKSLKGENISPEQIENLRIEIARLSKELQAPVPQEED